MQANTEQDIEMTHAEEIFRAVSLLVASDGDRVFTRQEVRRQAGINREDWNAGYSAIFQSMRQDHPGGAPRVEKKFAGVFRRISHGKHQLTEYGQQVVKDFKD